MDLLINPQNFEAKYNQYVGRVFPQWGGPPMYDWCFRRTVESKSSDILLLSEEGVPIAGTGVTYRSVRVGDVQIHAGILTGSWTTPEARGRGCFSRLIEEARARASERGVELLLAFVRSSNPSYRRLAAGGALCIPGFYLRFTPSDSSSASNIGPSISIESDSVLRELFQSEAKNSSKSIGFHYTLDSFESQFWKRPAKVDLMRVCDSIAIVTNLTDLTIVHYISERSGDTKTRECIESLVSWAISERRKLVLYTTSQVLSELCIGAGFECDSGFVTVNHSSKDWSDPNLKQLKERLTGTSWDLQDGDKM